MIRYTSWLAALAGLAYFVASGWVRPEPAGTMQLTEFGRLPVVEGGRIKPLDTFARVSLQLISSRQELKDDSDKTVKTKSAVQWLLDVWSSPDMFGGTAAKYKVFRIDSEVINFLKLEARPGSYRYSLAEIEPRYAELVQEYWRVREINAKKRDLFQTKLFEIGQHLSIYENIVRLRAPLVIPPQEPGDEEWIAVARIIEPMRRHYMQGLKEEMDKRGMKANQLGLREFAGIEAKIDELSLARLPQLSEPAAAFMRIIDRYRADDAAGFNEAITDYRTGYQTEISQNDRSKAVFETYFNHLSPFYHCALLYVILGLLACLSWLGMTPLQRAAMGLGTLTFLIHTTALVARMVIQGRPPVTNLYSSAVFIGWGCAGLLLLIERFYRNGIAIMLAGVTGAATLVVAHFLSLSGDTMEMMQAVLDTNFWLATHVTIMTSGYMASFVGGCIGIFYLVVGVLSPWLDRSLAKTLADMNYGVICFATMLSFVGTVLGGIWADQSWGRFWGWDPKENGALMVVIWNAMILHARWGGMIKARGVAVLAVAGNIVTTWSYFGTNQLGVGLHAYGFTSGVARTLVAFDAAMLAVVCLGLIPQRFWLSHQALTALPSSGARQANPAKVS